MSVAVSGKQERIQEFLRKSLLGEELVNTQFHLFSARSTRSGRLTRPRVLCANNVLLAKSSTYLSGLLSSDINFSDPALSDLTDANDIPTDCQIDRYGYGSDSDLDDDDEEPPTPISHTESPNDQSATISMSPFQISVTNQSKDNDELSEDGSGSVGSDMFVMSPEHPSMDELSLINLDRAGSVMSSKSVLRETQGSRTVTSHASMHVQGLSSRHILVKDTAFQTWYTFLNYLYTDDVNFLPLTSAAPGGQLRGCSTNSLHEPRCSAKSMYHLACKVGIDHLRDVALAHIRTNLTEQNILKELLCSLTSKHVQLLEMELDVLYAHIASHTVVAEFPALAQRIAKNEFPHGAAIIIGIHERLIKECRPSPLKPVPPQPPHSSSFGFASAPPMPSFGLWSSTQPIRDLSNTNGSVFGPPKSQPSGTSGLAVDAGCAITMPEDDIKSSYKPEGRLSPSVKAKKGKKKW